ncbi:MAG: hypothetical protein ACOC22_01435 [bacterium]
MKNTTVKELIEILKQMNQDAMEIIFLLNFFENNCNPIENFTYICTVL